MTKKFAVFDIDGTLIRWQLYHAVVDKLAKSNLLGTNAVAELHAARMKWKRRESGEEFKNYEKALIKLYEAALPSIPPSKFDALVQQVIAEYKDQVYIYTRDLLATLKQDAYQLLAISGSHQELVAQIGKYYGFDDWIGTVYERSESGFTGKSTVASHDKKANLEALINKHDLSSNGSYAVGDSLSDAPMLELVENPIAFNPDRALYQVAKSKGWKIVIERKNMVYQLESTDGNYLLAETN